jgi:hypothetical protein
MMQLTLQEVLEKIEKSYLSLRQGQRTRNASISSRSKDQPHRPEFYIPRIALRLANLRFSGSTK